MLLDSIWLTWLDSGLCGGFAPQEKGEVMDYSTDSTARIRLRQFLANCFSLDELKDLAFDLGINFQSLPHETSQELARELIAYFERRNQTRVLVVEALRQRPDDELTQLFSKLLGSTVASQSPSTVDCSISGQWIDSSDNDIVFFRQVGNQVIGFYNFDGRNRKVGVYLGTFTGRTLDYSWRWLDGKFEGHGRRTLLDDGKSLSGEWWYGKNQDYIEHVGYRRVSQQVPPWLNDTDLEIR